MQNKQTLIDLGFRKMSSSDEFLFRGRFQKFTAKIITYNPPDYIQLFIVCPDVDFRHKSDNYGKHFRKAIKDCCSNGSIKRALNYYDVPDDMIIYNTIGVSVNRKKKLRPGRAL